MRGLAVPILGVAALLGGCATIPRDMAWVREDAADAARLVLHKGWMIQRPLTLSCRPGSGTVDVTLVGLRRDGAVIELQSAKLVGRYAGAGLAEYGSDAPLEIRTTIPLTDPILTSFANTGDLAVVQGRVRMPTPNAFAPAHDFLAVCRG